MVPGEIASAEPTTVTYRLTASFSAAKGPDQQSAKYESQAARFHGSHVLKWVVTGTTFLAGWASSCAGSGRKALPWMPLPG